MKAYLHNGFSGIRNSAMMMMVVSTVSASAARVEDQSELELSLWNNTEFTIEFDGRRYDADRLFQVTHLEEGTYQLRVWKDEVNYNGNGGHRTILFNGNIDIPAFATVEAEVNRYKGIDILRIEHKRTCGTPTLTSGRPSAVRPKTLPHHDGRPGRPDYNNGPCVQQPHPMPCNTGYNAGCNGSNSCGHSNGCNTGCNDACNDGYNNGYDEVYNGISNSEMNDIFARTENAWNDDERLSLAKQMVGNRSLTAQQIKMMMEKFWFEDNRLDFAKWSYDRVSDYQQFYIVYDALWFSSSRKELSDYVAQF